MAKSFKEIGKKAEELIEKGNQAEQQVQHCQTRVTSAQNRVIEARNQLMEASMPDENGNPAGNVQNAAAQLRMAENQLEASRRALASAEDEVSRIKEQKNEHIREIDRYGKAEQSNMEKLRRLGSLSFAGDAAAFIKGLAERMNEAEEAKAALLRSMGINAPAHAFQSEGLGEGKSWNQNGSSMIDTKGGTGAYQGGRQEGTVSLGINPSSGGTPRTPSQILADIKDNVRENWMNNFNGRQQKNIFPEKVYAERLELYRKGVASLIGEEKAKELTQQDLEQLSYVQNTAFLAGCNLSENELKELYQNGCTHKGNFVTKTIEYKMDHVLQAKAFSLLQNKYTMESWSKSSTLDKQGKLRSLLTDMNHLFGTSVSSAIDYNYFSADDHSTRGVYFSTGNRIAINQHMLPKVTSYKLNFTMIHEMRHAYQHYAVQHPESVLVSMDTINAWKENFSPGNYKSVSEGFSFAEYVSQPVEWDAKNFAMQYDDLRGNGIVPVHTGSW